MARRGPPPHRRCLSAAPQGRPPSRHRNGGRREAPALLLTQFRLAERLRLSLGESAPERGGRPRLAGGCRPPNTHPPAGRSRRSPQGVGSTGVRAAAETGRLPPPRISARPSPLSGSGDRTAGGQGCRAARVRRMGADHRTPIRPAEVPRFHPPARTIGRRPSATRTAAGAHRPACPCGGGRGARRRITGLSGGRAEGRAGPVPPLRSSRGEQAPQRRRFRDAQTAAVTPGRAGAGCFGSVRRGEPRTLLRLRPLLPVAQRRRDSLKIRRRRAGATGNRRRSEAPGREPEPIPSRIRRPKPCQEPRSRPGAGWCCWGWWYPVR